MGRCDRAFPFRFVAERDSWRARCFGLLDAGPRSCALAQRGAEVVQCAARTTRTVQALSLGGRCLRVRRLLAQSAHPGSHPVAHWIIGDGARAQIAGLLYVGRNVVQVAVSYPIGFLADRFGHLPILIAGFVLGALTAILTALAFWFNADSLVFLSGIFFSAGLYMPVQEALEPTVTAEMVGSQTLALSYGALGAVNGTAKFVSSAAVGTLWTVVSPTFGVGFAAALMAAGTLALARLRAR